MTKTSAPFLTSMLYATLVPLFLVMLSAFFSIPYSLGSTPGDTHLTDSASATYHLT